MTWCSWLVSFLLDRRRLLLFSGGTIAAVVEVIQQLLLLLVNFFSASIAWREAPTITACDIWHWRKKKIKKSCYYWNFLSLVFLSFPTSLVSFSLLLFLLQYRKICLYKMIKQNIKKQKRGGICCSYRKTKTRKFSFISGGEKRVLAATRRTQEPGLLWPCMDNWIYNMLLLRHCWMWRHIYAPNNVRFLQECHLRSSCLSYMLS